jgi:hypothetical protein
MSRVWVVICIVLLGLLGAFVWLRTFRATLVLTEDQIQQALDEKFPIVKRELLGKISFEDPKVDLYEGTDRMGLGITVRAALPGMKEAIGRVEADGEIKYDPAKGELYFTKAVIRDLTISGVKEEDIERAKPLVSNLAASYLDRVPIYRLDPLKPKEARARDRIRSLKVEQGRLVLQLGL